MASAVGPFSVDNFPEELKCPVGWDLLTDPVTLKPCGHSINQAAAKMLFPDLSERGGGRRLVLFVNKE